MNRHMPVESTAAVAICRFRDSSTWPSGLSRSAKPPTFRMLVATVPRRVVGALGVVA